MWKIVTMFWRLNKCLLVCLAFEMLALSFNSSNCFNKHAVNVTGFFEKEREGDIDIAYHFQVP